MKYINYYNRTLPYPIDIKKEPKINKYLGSFN